VWPLSLYPGSPVAETNKTGSVMLQYLNMNGVSASVMEAVMLQCSGMEDFWAYTRGHGPESAPADLQGLGATAGYPCGFFGCSCSGSGGRGGKQKWWAWHQPT
jgi:hypothetical protein